VKTLKYLDYDEDMKRHIKLKASASKWNFQGNDFTDRYTFRFLEVRSCTEADFSRTEETRETLRGLIISKRTPLCIEG